MTPNQLAAKIRNLRESVPITAEFERVLTKRGVWNTNGVWYTSQKEHWLGWLKGYKGPGYYNRKDCHRTAEFVYNHINCSPMVLWLGEASRVTKAKVAKAKQAALSAKPHLPTQTAAIRKIIPWNMIEDRLGKGGGRDKKPGTRSESGKKTMRTRRNATKIMKETFPRQADYDLVLSQLSESIYQAKSVAPNAWAVTLFPDGFRLNVGQVEVLTAFQGQVRLLVQGALQGIDQTLLTKSPYKVPGDNYIFGGSIEQFRRYRDALLAAHQDFISAAGTTKIGRPWVGTPHRGSHSSGLADLAAAVAYDFAEAVAHKSEKTRTIHWVKSDELDGVGHGVEFFHDELSGQSDRTPVAFLEKYGWREGGPATVRLLGTRPSAITAAHWPEIIESARRAVHVFLSNEANFNESFHHGPIHILFNA